MAQQITPLSPSLPATTGIQDPATRQFAAAVSDILRTAQSPGYALSQLVRATTEMSGGNTPAAVQQWLASSELYDRLTRAIQQVDASATLAVAQERQDRVAAIAAEAQARADDLAIEVAARSAAVQGVADDLAQEVLDRVAAVQAETAARIQAVQNEASARAAAVQSVVDDLEQEVTDRAAAVQAESAARAQALLNEAAARGTAISQEAATRQGADDAIAQSVTNLSASVGGSISAIQGTLTTLADADSAEATARQTLAAQLRGTYEGDDLSAVPSGLLYQERVARVSGDETVAQSVTSLQTSVGNSLATLGDEIETVSTAVSSEASARQTLASQMRGTYEGGDLSSITSGLLYQERTARTAADQGLAQQITLLSAGAGEQFDYKKIWYFDSGNEGWTGNGTPTASGGWLRPANATDPYLVSPTGIAADGAQYTQVRLRIRKTGTPTWAGELWWRTAADSTWDSARKTTISEPTYDGNGIGLVTINLPWSGVIDRVRVDLSTVQDAGNGYDVDWVAVGRPSPGASSAALLEESLARTSAIDAEATSRRALSTKLTGLQDPASATLATLSSGLLHDERQARSSADSTEVTARQNLSVKLTGLADPASATLATLSSGLIYDERTARVSQDGLLATSISTLSGRVADAEANIVNEESLRVAGDSAQATARQSLSTKLTGLADPSSATLATLTDGLIYDERVARSAADASEVTARQGLSAKLTGMTDPSGATLAGLSSGLIYDERTARAAQDGVLATQISTVSATAGAKNRTYSQTAAPTSGMVAGDLWFDTDDSNKAYRYSGSAWVATSDTRIAANSSAITTEATTRASADAAEATARQALSAKLTGLNDPSTATLATLASGLIYDERQARVSQDGVLASSISTLSGRVAEAEADISTETSLRVAGDNAQATARQALSTKLTGLADPASATLAGLTSGLLYDERQARSSADASEVTARQNLSVKLTGVQDPASATLATLASGLLYDERTARVAQDGVLASSISTLSGRMGDAEADIVEEVSLRVAGDQANANAISGLSGRMGNAEAAITTETGLRVNADLALTQSISTQAGRIDNANTAITSEATTRTNNDLAIVSAVNTALAQITGVSTSISQSGQNLIANWSQAQANKWNQIEAEVLTSGGQTIRAALQQESNARATLAGQVSATWTVKAEVDSGTGKPYIAGLALGASGQGGATTSEFIVRADALKVMMPGYGDYVPFAIGDFGPAMFGDGGFSVPVSRLVNQAAQPTSFLETFESGSVAQWKNYTGAGELSVVSVADSLTGGKVLRIGNNSGGDQAWLIHKQNIPFDPSALYRIKFRVRRTAGSGMLYLGLAGVAADGVTLVNALGENTHSNQHYVAANNQGPGSTWTEYVGYVKGTAATGQFGTNPSITAPLKLHQSVKYIRPLILANYQNLAGTLEVDYCSIELMTDAMSWDVISGAGKPENGATVGAPAGTLVAGVPAANVATAVTDFNASNNRNSAAITAPTILTDGTAVDHVAQTDGSVDISFEWSWSGSEGDIDGFLVFARQSASSSAYTLGTTPAEETVYTVPANKRAFVLFGVAADKYYTFGIQAYRAVDKAINAAGVIKSTLVKATGSGENPYRPSSTVAFTGDVTGTISGTSASTLVSTASTALTNANAAQQDADTANAALADLAADNKLTPAEKQSIRKEWDAVYAERAGIRAQADSFGITTEKTNYDNAFQALGTYLNGGTAYAIGATPPSWITDANLATTTTIVGTTFRANWLSLYANRQALLNKISAEAAKRADWAVISGVGKPEDGATVGADDSNYTGGRGNNLLRNSMLKDSIAGWGYALGPGCVLGEFRTLLNENGAPKGYGALKLSFSGTASSVYESQVFCGDLAVPCVPGERMELGARVGVHRGDAQLTASFLLEDGSFMLYVPVTGGVSEATSQAAWTQNLSDLQHLWGFVTAPANAVKCYMEVRVKRTTTAAPTDLYIALPYIGKAGAAQTVYSPWNQGAFITPSEITTWIANAAIGNAEIDRASINKLQVVTADIQDLAVDTLKIAGNAVTIPVTASGGYNNGDGFQNWKIVCTVPITLDFPAFVYAHAVLSQSFPYGDRTWGAFISISGQGGMTVGGQRLSDSASLAATRYLSAGSHTITLYWSSDSGGDVISSSIFALAVKR